MTRLLGGLWALALTLFLLACADSTSAAPDMGETPRDAAVDGAPDLDADSDGATRDARPPLRDRNVTPRPDAAPPPSCGELSVCGRICADLDTDPRNCGQCGRTCILPDAVTGCAEGECTIIECLPEHYDEDGDPDNGCEAFSQCDEDAPCETECGSTGALICDGPSAECGPPEEACNAADDDCDGACDEGGVDGCRVGVHRGHGNGHIYSTDLNRVDSDPFHVEAENYFYLYTEPVEGMRPVFLCPKDDGRRFLSSANDCEIGRGPEATLGFWSPTPQCGAAPLYRLYHADSDNHFYTTSPVERESVLANLGYLDEGVAGYIWAGP
jgi:hypothetical protein